MTSDATPEEAKRLWEEAEASGGKPTFGSIAKQLGIAPATVMRWKRDGWTRREANTPNPSEGQPGKPMQKMVEVIDEGGGTVNVDALKAAIEALVGGKGELERLLTSSAQDLLTEIERMNLVTMLAAQKLAQATLPVIPVKDLGKFVDSVASATMRTAAAAKFRSQLPTPTPGGHAVADSPKVIKHDDLDPAWAAMRKLMANPPAEPRA